MPTVRKIRAPLLQRVSRVVEIVEMAHSTIGEAAKAETPKDPTAAQAKTSARLRLRARSQLLLAAEQLRKAAAKL